MLIQQILGSGASSGGNESSKINETIHMFLDKLPHQF